MNGKPRNRRFGIRDLLYLAVIAALCTGWWIDSARRKSNFDRVRSELNFVHRFGIDVVD